MTEKTYFVEGDHRTILKYKDGIPYEHILPEVPSVRTIIRRLNELKEKGIEQPIYIAGDLTCLKTLNNKYGREVADSLIAESLTVFCREFKTVEGCSVASPSGDEMWAVLDDKMTPEEAISKVHISLSKMNNLNVETETGTKLGSNARFYIGTKGFDKIESHLKYNSETGEKYPPGTIVVEGKLLNRDKDVVIHPKGVSYSELIENNTKEINRGNTVKQKTAVEFEI